VNTFYHHVESRSRGGYRDAGGEMMKRIHRIAVLAALAAMVASATVRATTIARWPIAKMTRASDVVVPARCIANATDWDAGEIWTVTTFQTLETWKGRGTGLISVGLLGGTAGKLTSTVDGVPRFHAGEEVVLLLERTARGEFSVVSWMQGTFRIRFEQKTNEETVAQDTAAFSTYDPDTRRFEASGIRGTRLETLREQVTAARGAVAERKP
jgi:hypothetical protein